MTKKNGICSTFFLLYEFSQMLRLLDSCWWWMALRRWHGVQITTINSNITIDGAGGSTGSGGSGS